MTPARTSRRGCPVTPCRDLQISRQRICLRLLKLVDHEFADVQARAVVDPTEEDPQLRNERKRCAMSSSLSSPATDEALLSPAAATFPPRGKNHLDTYRGNRQRLYPDVSDALWNDWKWQQKN